MLAIDDDVEREKFDADVAWDGGRFSMTEELLSGTMGATEPCLGRRKLLGALGYGIHITSTPMQPPVGLGCRGLKTAQEQKRCRACLRLIMFPLLAVAESYYICHGCGMGLRDGGMGTGSEGRY